MSVLRKIIAWISVFAIAIFVFCVPAFASSGSAYNQKIGFWEWAVQWCPLKDFLGYTTGIGSCPTSDDGYHHANSYQVDRGDGTYKCICTYCGHTFTAYESDLQQSYNDYVGTLPATGYNSDGSLIVTVPVSYVTVDYHQQYSCAHLNNVFPDKFRFICDEQTHEVTFMPNSGQSILFSPNYSIGPVFCYTWTAPVTGYYTVVGGNCTLDYVDVDDGPHYRNNQYTSDKLSYQAGDTISFIGGCGDVPSRYSNYAYYVPTPVVYEVISVTSLGSTYNTTTRPTGITGGNYGIVGDDGQLTVVNGDIINETNNTYYNPATGQSGTINNWSYDYSDRSYNLTLDSGNTVTVRYGDENITIIEGDVTYIIYYIMDGSGSDPGPSASPDVSTHIHNWQETGRTEPTCTAPGQIKYTCEYCGQTQVEVLPATGHIWQVERTVQTSYDDEGNLIQQGYTIYQCSVCGEQYKDVQGTGPPGSSGDSGSNGESIWDKIGKFFGTILGGIIGMIEAVISKILDGLISLAEMIMDKLTAVVEVVLSIFEEVPKLFGGFLDFLSAMFPFLPDDIMLLLTFGIAAVVFIGIIKAIRR